MFSLKREDGKVERRRHQHGHCKLPHRVRNAQLYDLKFAIKEPFLCHTFTKQKHTGSTEKSIIFRSLLIKKYPKTFTFFEDLIKLVIYLLYLTFVLIFGLLRGFVDGISEHF